MTHGGCRGWRKARAWAAATALAAGTAFPTQGAPLTDWGAAVASAWSRHPQSAGWPERGRESAAAREAASAGAPEPASVTLGVRDDRVGSGRGRQEWEVEFAVPLWLPGQRDARIAEADSRSDETAARAALARWESHVLELVRRHRAAMQAPAAPRAGAAVVAIGRARAWRGHT